MDGNVEISLKKFQVLKLLEIFQFNCIVTGIKSLVGLNRQMEMTKKRVDLKMYIMEIICV